MGRRGATIKNNSTFLVNCLHVLANGNCLLFLLAHFLRRLFVQKHFCYPSRKQSQHEANWEEILGIFLELHWNFPGK